MKTIFVDASFWIALVNPRDSLHRVARAVEPKLGFVRFVTSEMVLTELLNGVAKGGEALRKAALALVKSLRRRSNILIVPQTSDQFQVAMELYAARPDKTWGLTDCASFHVMATHGVTEALTHDHHFSQAGFIALLRDPYS